MMKTTMNGKRLLGLFLSFAGLLYLGVPSVRAGQSEQQQQQQPDQPPMQSDQADADQPAPNDTQDPPTRVARISYLDGSVSMQPGGAGDWGAAARNRPMTIGDKLWTDKDSRAELQTGVVSIHLGSMTALSFLNLDQTITQMRLAEGSINFRVKEIREGDTYEVDTPNAVFTITQAGAFRVDVNENGDNTGVTVIRGAGTVTASGKTYDLQPGQRGIFNGTDDVQSTVAPQAPPADGLDNWANDRDLGEQNSISKKYVPEDMPGTQDLDNNGTWSEDGANGPIWYPSEVGPDWAPYSNGYWSYVGPWGWTWVDYAPWGFAPFHYGRWGFVGSRWGWYPGPRFGGCVYGPAFVGFLGGGVGFGFGVGFGVGWFPLGFGEPFHPWFHAGFGYWNRVNIHNTVIRNTTIIRNSNHFNYSYSRNTRAVTAASRSAFTGGQSINRGAAHINEASLRGAQVRNGAGFSPTRQSSFGAANARGNVSRPPSSVENRSVMARTSPGASASHLPVRTMNTNGLTPGRAGTSGSNLRQQNNIPGNRPSAAGGNNSRNWSAQGNSTDRGQAPKGFGSNGGPSNSNMAARANNRPPWAGAGSAGAGATVGNSRSYAQGSTSLNNRSYTPQSQSRAYTPQSRSYTPPSTGGRSYSAPAPRTYTAPSRSYGGGSSAPRSSGSAAPRGGGGGGASHGGGGGSPHGGGGGGGRPHR